MSFWVYTLQAPYSVHNGVSMVGGVEFGVDTMSTPGRVDAQVSGFGMLLNDLAKVSEEGARLHKFDCHI